MAFEAHPQLPGVLLQRLQTHTDSRGWLLELFRDDELPSGFRPAMGYVSATKPGVARGPHEHADQTDGFAFTSGQIELHLWENRPDMGDAYVRLSVGESEPTFVVVPPGVVHAYRNVGDSDALVLNFPNRLYAGEGKKEPVDEIRHEDAEGSRFKL